MVSTPADWYPDPSQGDVWRWWDGQAWTPHVSGYGRGAAPRPRASLTPLFMVLAAVGVLVGLFGMLVLLGEARVDARSGVTGSGSDLVIVNVVCPGEQLLEIRLWRQFGDGTGGETLWRAEGATGHVGRITVGAEIPGLTTVTPFTATVAADDRLELTVGTTELRSPYAIIFTPADIADGTIVRGDEVFADRREFEQAIQQRSPCGDPYDTAGDRRLLWVFAGPLLAYFVALIVGAQWARKRDRSVPMPPKPPVPPAFGRP